MVFSFTSRSPSRFLEMHVGWLICFLLLLHFPWVFSVRLRSILVVSSLVVLIAILLYFCVARLLFSCKFLLASSFTSPRDFLTMSVHQSAPSKSRLQSRLSGVNSYITKYKTRRSFTRMLTLYSHVNLCTVRISKHKAE